VDRDTRPAWSPDGQRIAYVHRTTQPITYFGKPENYEIYVMNADGSDARPLTDSASLLESEPAWSPDGRRIAFTSNRKSSGRTISGRFNIYLLPVAGLIDPGRIEPTLLTDVGGSNSAPDWSPDGRTIAFQSTRDGNLDIYVLAVAGSFPRQLTEHPDADHSPAWSPDGARIAFVSDRDGNEEIYVMAADGSNQTRLTFASDFDKGPAWSPDGQFIVYYSSWLRNAEIWVMRADGSARMKLTDHADFDGFPAWQPRPAEGVSFVDHQLLH
jgi:TolB protein